MKRLNHNVEPLINQVSAERKLMIPDIKIGDSEQDMKTAAANDDIAKEMLRVNLLRRRGVIASPLSGYRLLQVINQHAPIAQFVELLGRTVSSRKSYERRVSSCRLSRVDGADYGGYGCLQLRNAGDQSE